MASTRWLKKAEALFDGEEQWVPPSERAIVSESAECESHLARLSRIREAVAASARVETIGEGQVPAFAAGIQEALDARPRSRRGLWAVASLSAAALILALALSSLFSKPVTPVTATEVEWVSTDLEGATVSDWYNAEDGVATVWVEVGEDDVW